MCQDLWGFRRGCAKPSKLPRNPKGLSTKYSVKDALATNAPKRQWTQKTERYSLRRKESSALLEKTFFFARRSNGWNRKDSGETAAHRYPTSSSTQIMHVLL
ncbi:MAG: hypothetical protein B6D41_08555 [Chloroflexi bacterium UTCFX4]|nr:MAG: hypothetical protein B6D41_08555 [Chloroflexi bacterium UTCFX4]